MSTTTVGTTPTQQEPRPAFHRLQRGQVIGGILLLALITIVVLTAFGEPMWQLLGFGTLLLSVVIVVLLALGVLLITLGIAAITRRRTRIMPWLGRFFRLLLVLGALLAALAGAMFGSQLHTSTPPILGADGKPLPGSIAALEQVTLNGSQEWISIRGKNMRNPVLLQLDGGPGGSYMAHLRTSYPTLEDHFIVVAWDQPGAGKSYNAVPIGSLTIDRYVSDAHALIQLLCTRFHQNKIYLTGDSWGTVPGILLVQRYPELFYAYVGTGQRTSVLEDDRMGYALALKIAAERGDTATVEKLRHNGPPPYLGSDPLDRLWKNFDYLAVLDFYAWEHIKPEKTAGLPAMMSWMGQEDGLVDKVNFFRGLYDTFAVVYPQLYAIDFSTQATRLGAPVYFLQGRWDLEEMGSLLERYYRVLQAPHKELIYFENSAHTPPGDEPSKFVDVLVNHILPQTYH